MVTIKEISKKAGFSPSTVSIVLGGKSSARKISDNTKTKILETARRLGYRANVAAKRLKAGGSLRTLLSVFMTIDSRAYIMTRFLLGLRNAAEELNQDFEIAVHFFKNGELRKLREHIELTNCAIVCNTSDEDLAFLEEGCFLVPMVLYNRSSKKYSSVITDYHNIGKNAAEIFVKRKRTSAVLLGTDVYYNELKETTGQFIKTAENGGMSVKHMRLEPIMANGYNAGIEISKMNPLPDAAFSLSNALSIGMLHGLKEKDITVPEQIELISIGIEDPEWEEYASVPISSMQVPVEAMVLECVKELIAQMKDGEHVPKKTVVPSKYVKRISCGGNEEVVFDRSRQALEF